MVVVHLEEWEIYSGYKLTASNPGFSCIDSLACGDLKFLISILSYWRKVVKLRSPVISLYAGWKALEVSKHYMYTALNHSVGVLCVCVCTGSIP